MARQGFAFVFGIAALASLAAPAGAAKLRPFDDDAYYRQGDELLVSGPQRYGEMADASSSLGGCEPTCGAADSCCAADPCCGDGIDCGDACDCGSGCTAACPIFGAVEKISLSGLLGVEEGDPLVIGGWSQWGYHDNNDGVFNTYPNHFQAQQQYLYAGWTADGSAGLGLGGRVDVLYGTDGSNTQAFGNNPGNWDFQNGYDHGVYGWALPQAYGEAAFGDWNVKVGHFYTLLGYQVVPATGNFFYSIPYTFNFSEAFTHTGALATYTGIEGWTFYGGWTLGWDTGFDQFGGGNSALSGFSAAPMDHVTFTYINTIGDLGWIGDNGYTHSCVLDLKLTDTIEYVGQSDLVGVDNSVASAGGHYDTIGLNQYLFYQFTDMIRSGARVEWWKADGVSLYEMAYGLNIKPASNLIIRPEYRYNWCPTDNLPPVLPVVSTTGNSTSAGDYIDRGIAAVDVILTF